MFDSSSSATFYKNWRKFQFWDQILQNCNFGSRSLIPINILIISMFECQISKNRARWNFETKSVQVFNFGSRSSISNVIFMIKELNLLWLPNFIALGIYFVFGTKFSWNEGIDTWFNVKCVLRGRNFDFLGGYCSLLFVTWWLQVVTARSQF